MSRISHVILNLTRIPHRQDNPGSGRFIGANTQFAYHKYINVYVDGFINFRRIALCKRLVNVISENNGFYKYSSLRPENDSGSGKHLPGWPERITVANVVFPLRRITYKWTTVSRISAGAFLVLARVYIE